MIWIFHIPQYRWVCSYKTLGTQSSGTSRRGTVFERGIVLQLYQTSCMPGLSWWITCTEKMSQPSALKKSHADQTTIICSLNFYFYFFTSPSPPPPDGLTQPGICRHRLSIKQRSRGWREAAAALLNHGGISDLKKKKKGETSAGEIPIFTSTSCNPLEPSCFWFFFSSVGRS